MRPTDRVTLAILLFLSAAPLGAADFDPEARFPGDSFLYVFADVGGLREAFPRTPLGSLLSHPEIRRGLGSLPKVLAGRIRGKTQAVKQMLQMDVFELLDLFQGRVAVAVRAVGQVDLPDVYIALELGAKKKEIVALAAKLAQFATFTRMVRKVESEATVLGQPVRVFQPAGLDTKLHLVVLEEYLVVVLAKDTAAVVARLQGQGGESVARSPRFARAKKRAGFDDSLLVAYLDVRALEKNFVRGREERQGLEALGLHKVESLSGHLRLRDDDWEGKVLLQNDGPFQGLLKSLSDSFGGPESYEALERIPASAAYVCSFSVNPAAVFQALAGGAEARGAEDGAVLSGLLDDGLAILEQAAGGPLRDDLAKLPRLDVHAFQVTPPAGCLIPDTVVLLEEKEARPYLALLEKLAGRLGSSVPGVKVRGEEVTCLRFHGILGKLGIPVSRDALDPAVTVAYRALEDGWIAVSDSPQAIARHLSHYSKEAKRFSELPGVSKRIGDGSGRSRALAFLRGEKSLLAIYNTAVDGLHLIGPSVQSLLDTYGVDPALFPPAEVFLPRFSEGFVIVQKRPDEISLHGHRVLTHVVGDAVISLAVLAARLAPISP